MPSSPDKSLLESARPLPWLIVNADDLGLCAAVNRGIARAHRQGILTSASLLANAPAFDGGVEVACDNPSLGIGVHLNIVRGRPVSAPENVGALLGADGRFAGIAGAVRRAGRKAVLSAAEREYRAQIERILGAGIRPTHIDSEKHHCRWRPLRSLMWRLARAYGIPAVRNLREPVCLALRILPWPGWRPALRAFGLRLVASIPPAAPPPEGPAEPDWFFGQTHIGAMGERVWLSLLPHLPSGVSEVMCHPGEYVAAEAEECAVEFGASWLAPQRPQELAALISSAVKSLAAEYVRLTNFGILQPAGAKPPAARAVENARLRIDAAAGRQ
ncbi:MAG: ChbG/HpnK family deacetylase [Planctomycetota bacterium]|nr:ChbG/HpnK family deacetylase [Planctomycetota bacterium]